MAGVDEFVQVHTPCLRYYLWPELTIGLHVAEQSLFVNIARLLWGFNLDFAKDENGNDIPIDFTTKGLSPGFLSIPKPFKCCMFPFHNS